MHSELQYLLMVEINLVKKEYIENDEYQILIDEYYEKIENELIMNTLDMYKVRKKLKNEEFESIRNDYEILDMLKSIAKKQFNLVYPDQKYLIEKGLEYNPIGEMDKEKKNKIYKMFNLFKKYYIQSTGLVEAFEQIDKTTQMIIEKCPDPKKNKTFYYHGGVYAYPQMGKTTNYCGLINKLIDVEFDVIIVLAGRTNEMRSQTQERCDLYCIGEGYDNEIVGVGNQRLNEETFLTKCTFRNDISKEYQVTYSDQNKYIFVVKKLQSILSTVYKVVSNFKGKNPKLSIAIINDESDDATINTKKSDENPTEINKLVRDIRDIGKEEQTRKTIILNYTATPFADIVIGQNDEHSDLFPKDIITVLEAPLSYLGPKEFFGENSYPFVYDKTILDELSIEDDIKKSAIDKVSNKDSNNTGQNNYAQKNNENNDRKCSSDDEDDKENQKNSRKDELPKSLEEAILVYLVNGAILEARNKKIRNNVIKDKTQINIHHSMLINVEVNNDPQEKINKLVLKYLESIKEKVLTNNSNELYEQVSAVYNKSKSRALEEIKEIDNIRYQRENEFDYDYSFEDQEIIENFKEYVFKVKVELINGKSGESLDYSKNPEGLHVIAIGGLKLSRGLTLEGLTVSYFFRNSKAADVLLQCCRWFGYRDKIRDLIYVFTTEVIKNRFELSERILDILMQQFNQMAAEDKSPSEFRSFIVQYKELDPTAANKRRCTIEHNDFAERNNLDEAIVESNEGHSATFELNDEQCKENKKVLEELISQMGNDQCKIRNGNRYYKNVELELITNFLKKVTVSNKSHLFKNGQTQGFINYIKYLNDKGKLNNFRVLIFNNTSEKDESETVKVEGIGEIYTSNQVIDRKDCENTYSVNLGKAINYRHIQYVLEDDERGEVEKITSRKYSNKQVPEIKKVMRVLSEKENKCGILAIYILNKTKLYDCDILKGIEDRINENPIIFGMLLPDNLANYRLEKVQDIYGIDIKQDGYRILLQNKYICY